VTIPGGSRILVTGAAGFVGACVARRLVTSDCEVHALLRPDRDAWRLSGLQPKLNVHPMDLAEAGEVRSLLRRISPEVVVHCATHGAYASQVELRTILETNVVASGELFAACLDAGVRLVVNVGSSSEYGFKSEPMRESDRLEPNSVYAVGKAAQTQLAALMGKGGATAIVTFRLFSVYGPFEEPTRLVPTLIRRAKAGLDLELADPDIAHDFVFVEDVVDALVDFRSQLGHGGSVFNLGSGRQTTLKELALAVVDTVSSPSQCRFGVFPARHWDTTTWQADASLARERLGWSARHDLRQGLAKTAAWQEVFEGAHADQQV
jgi:nucleoside-diphosphate-sugar epimerase